jgi:hypothetical protein
MLERMHSIKKECQEYRIHYGDYSWQPIPIGEPPEKPLKPKIQDIKEEVSTFSEVPTMP